MRSSALSIDPSCFSCPFPPQDEEPAINAPALGTRTFGFWFLFPMREGVRG
jgi:hypothetical protein